MNMLKFKKNHFTVMYVVESYVNTLFKLIYPIENE